MRIAQKRPVWCVAIVISAIVVVGSLTFVSSGHTARGLSDAELSMIRGESEAEGCVLEQHGRCHLANECTHVCFDGPMGQPITTDCDGQRLEYVQEWYQQKKDPSPPNGETEAIEEVDCVYIAQCADGVVQKGKYCSAPSGYTDFHCLVQFYPQSKDCQKCIIMDYMGEFEDTDSRCTGCP